MIVDPDGFLIDYKNNREKLLDILRLNFPKNNVVVGITENDGSITIYEKDKVIYDYDKDLTVLDQYGNVTR